MINAVRLMKETRKSFDTNEIRLTELDPRSIAKYISGNCTKNEASEIENTAAISAENSKALYDSWQAISRFEKGVISHRVDPFVCEALQHWLQIVKNFGPTASRHFSSAGTFVGRHHELEESIDRILKGSSRFFTVTGQRGIGKTACVNQLATKMFSQFPDGVWMIECEEMSGPNHFLAELCAEVDPEVTEVDLQNVCNRIGSSKSLLILDDTPNDIGLQTIIEELLTACPLLQTITSSVLPLIVPSEFHLELAPLTLSESLELFRDKTKDVGMVAGIELNAEAVCAQLGGLPLAIEYAAEIMARTSPDDLLQRLGSVPSQNLGTTALIEYLIIEMMTSLEESDAFLLCSLCAFQGPFTFEDAQTVSEMASSEVRVSLTRLSQKSLVSLESCEGKATYLVKDRGQIETYGRLDIARLQESKRRHARIFEPRAKSIGQLLKSGQWSEGLKALERHGSNISSAIEYAIKTETTELIASIADSMLRTYIETGRTEEFDRLATHALRSAIDTNDLAFEARCRGLFGAMCSRNGDERACTEHWNRRVEICEQTGDHHNLVDALGDLAAQAFDLEDFENAILLASEAEERAEFAEIPELVATARIVIARTCLALGQFDLAREWSDKTAEALGRSTDKDLTLFVYQSLAIFYDDLGESDLALQAATTALDDALDGGRGVHIGLASSRLGSIYESKGDIAQSAFYLLQSVNAHREAGSRHKRRAESRLNTFVEKYGELATEVVERFLGVPWQTVLYSRGKL